MTEYFTVYREEIIGTIIAIVVLFLIRILLFKTIKKVGKIGDIDRNRTLLILKYIDVFILIVGVITLSLLWGVAFFASWSILSNITAGVILFFSFPFKIGDRIRIQDKDFPSEAIIEDIRAFHLHLRTDDGELITYPNSLMLQKGIVVIDNPQREDDGKSTL